MTFEFFQYRSRAIPNSSRVIGLLACDFVYVSHQRWTWGNHCMQARKNASKGSILALNDRADVTRNPQQKHQWLHKNTDVLQFFFLKKYLPFCDQWVFLILKNIISSNGNSSRLATVGVEFRIGGNLPPSLIKHRRTYPAHCQRFSFSCAQLHSLHHLGE